MESTIETKKVVHLILSEEEADWLHEHMRNPHYEPETSEDSMMRARFFHATQREGS